MHSIALCRRTRSTLKAVPNRLQQFLALAIVPRVAALTIRMLAATLRFEDHPAPGVIPGDQITGPTIYAFWHQALLLAACRFKDRSIAILISRSFDGELIARTVERLGFHAIRGSSSRGGPTALRQMAEAFRSGHICALTADGPRGPARIAKPGTTQLAQLVGAPAGSFYLKPERAWQLHTWDGFLIPKPFTRVAIFWPAIIPAAEVSVQTVQQSLDESVAMAVSNDLY